MDNGKAQNKMYRKKQNNDTAKKFMKPDMQKKQGQNPVAQKECIKGKSNKKSTVQKNAANRKADVDFTLQKKKYKKNREKQEIHSMYAFPYFNCIRIRIT